MADATAVPWGQIVPWALAAMGATGAALTGAFTAIWTAYKTSQEKRIDDATAARKAAEARAERAEKDASGWKGLWKEEQWDREKRIQKTEVAVDGTPSVRPPRAEQNTLMMLVESANAQTREAELNKRVLSEVASGHANVLALEAFVPRPTAKDLLPKGSTRADYDDRRVRNAQHGFDTPQSTSEPYRRRQETLKDSEK